MMRQTQNLTIHLKKVLASISRVVRVNSEPILPGRNFDMEHFSSFAKASRVSYQEQIGYSLLDFAMTVRD